MKKRAVFSVQQHAATHMHFDFRLEIDGVLKSWSVPKGPSLNPKVKRLALATADHDRSYAYFEGVIPEGSYGAGKVLLWDRGTYRNLQDTSMKSAYRKGVLEFCLSGKKLKGAFALIKMKGRKGQWLLIKMKDEKSDARKNIIRSSPQSVKSGKTLKEIRGT